MKTKPPIDAKTGLIDDLYDKVMYWLYQERNPTKALPFAKRLEKLLDKVDSDQGSIFGQECRALICEAKADLVGAIRHRKREIKMIDRLQKISRGTPSEAYALKDYGFADLSDRLDILAVLYRENGQLDKAIAALLQSKELCEAHGIPFDGEDLLEECRALEALA